MSASFLLFLAACGATRGDASVTATPTDAGVRVEASAPVERVEVRTADGLPVRRMSPPSPTATVDVPASLAPGSYTVVATIAGASVEAAFAVEAAPPVRVEVQPRPGGAWVAAEGTIAVPVVEGGAAEVLVGVTGGPDMPAEVAFAAGDRRETVALGTVGARVTRTVTVRDAPVEVTVGETRFTLAPSRWTKEALARVLTVEGDAFPATADGAPDVGRPEGRVPLPSPTWERLVRTIGLGGRRRDEVAPWAYWGITLANSGDEALDVVVALGVRDAAGPSSAFRPRLRTADGDTGTVAALVRVPPKGRAVASLPVFVDTRAVEPGEYAASLTVTPLGGDTPVRTVERTVYVSRGDGVASAGFALSIAAFLGGATLVRTRLRRWLDAAATSELMTIALFGSALFLVGTAADVLAMGVGAIFGPISTLFTGLVNDLGRYALLATLVTLLPRPGTLTLALLTGWFLRGFTTGSFAPVDLLYTGASVGFAEGFAWIAGLTRSDAWRDEGATRRWARLSLGFAGASICTTLSGLWLHTVLYRLFFAPWYVAMQVLGPGLLYTVVACRVATGFAASLRRVEA